MVYYPKLKPKIEQISKKIANLRKSKDISQKNEIITEVKLYSKYVDDLYDIYDELILKIPALEDYSSKMEMEDERKKRWDILKIIFSALFGALGSREK